MVAEMSETGAKVLIFGTFTEEETRLFQSQSAENGALSPEKTQFKFGSLDFASVITSKGLNIESEKPGLSSRSGVHASKLIPEEKAYKIGNMSVLDVPKELPGAQLKGSTNGFLLPTNEISGKRKVSTDFGLLPISENKIGHQEQLESPYVHDNEDQRTQIQQRWTTSFIMKLVLHH